MPPRVAPPPARPSLSRATLRVGSVSFLNATPLIHGLDGEPGVELSREVPSRLLDGLRQGRYDVALLPVIDYQRMPGLRLLTAGGIGCDGPTLTVRLFSDVPLDRVRTLACDTDSHTSVALARVVYAERFGFVPEVVPLTEGAGNASARLLIGDKVVSHEPRGLPFQLDLGEAWKQLTGLPFVFAAWMAPQRVDLRDLPRRLEAAKNKGLSQVDAVVAGEASSRGWPHDLARRYLTELLRFDVGPRQIEAIERFYALAFKHGVLADAPAPLRLYEG